MKKEATNMALKAAKIAGVTCLALGTAAVITSGAAIKALVEGGKYLADSVKKIIHEEPEAEVQTEEAAEPVRCDSEAEVAQNPVIANQ